MLPRIRRMNIAFDPILPIGAIVGALVGVAFAMARPALLFLGLMKAYELLRTKSTNQN